MYMYINMYVCVGVHAYVRTYPGGGPGVPRTRLCLKRVATSRRRPHRRIFSREPINSFHLFLFR